MALSHREYSPVSMFEGVKVSVEYIDTRLCCTVSDHIVGELGGSIQEHSSHIQCYRTTRTTRGGGGNTSNGNITR